MLQAGAVARVGSGLECLVEEDLRTESAIGTVVELSGLVAGDQAPSPKTGMSSLSYRDMRTSGRRQRPELPRCSPACHVPARITRADEAARRRCVGAWVLDVLQDGQCLLPGLPRLRRFPGVAMGVADVQWRESWA